MVNKTKLITFFTRPNKSLKVQAAWPGFPQQTKEWQSVVVGVSAFVIPGKAMQPKKIRSKITEKYLNLRLICILVLLLI